MCYASADVGSLKLFGLFLLLVAGELRHLLCCAVLCCLLSCCFCVLQVLNVVGNGVSELPHTVGNFKGLT